MKYNAFISYAHAADGQLTPVLQSALHKLGKPWYKRRALNVFRDKTNLPVTPELWPTIVKALEKSEYFILMASPESAASKWVLPEVEYWLKYRSIDTLLIVHTGGALCWDDEKEDFDPEKTDALHPVLFGKFPHEPFIVGLTAIKSTKDRNLSNPGFRDPVIRLAATLHKLPQNDFIGEEIKQHKRTLRIRNGAFITLSLLLVGVGFFYWRSVQNGKMSKKNLSQALTTLSAMNIEQDPTLSFRLAEAAYKNDPKNTDAHIRLMDAANYYMYDVIPGKVLGMSDDHSKMVYIADNTLELCVLDFNTKDTVCFKGDFSEVPDSFFNYWLDKDFFTSGTIIFNRDLTKFCMVNPMNPEPVRVFNLERNTEITLDGDARGNLAGFSPSGDKLFITDWLEELPLSVWNLNNGKPISLKGNTDKCSKAAFTPDNSFLTAYNIGRKPIKVWNLNTGDSLYVPDDTALKSNDYDYYSEDASSSDGRRFALETGGFDSELFVYEIGKSVQCIFNIPAKNSPRYIEFTKDGNNLVALGTQTAHKIRVFDLEEQREIIMENSSVPYKRMQIASDGSRLLAFELLFESELLLESELDEGISLWDIKSGRKLKLEDFINGYNFSGFSPKGKKLFGLNRMGDLPVKIWDSNSGELLFTIFYPYPSSEACFSSDDQKILLFSRHSSIIKVIDMKNGRETKLFGNLPGVDEVVFTSVNEIMAIDHATGQARIWDMSEGKELHIFEKKDQYAHVMFSEDASIMVVYDYYGKETEFMRVWDLQQTRKIDLEGAVTGFNLAVLSPDTKKLVAYNHIDNKLPARLWEIPSGKVFTSSKFNSLFSGMSSIIFNTSGDKVLARKYSSGSIKVYDLHTLDTISLENSSGYSKVLFSNTGDKVLAYHYSGELTPAVWELKTGKRLPFPESGRNFREASFSPDGSKVIAYRHVIGGDHADTMILWDLVSGDTISLENNNYNFRYASFSPNGHWLIAYDFSEGLMFQLWNTKTWKNITLEDNLVGLDEVYFSNNGNKIVAFEEAGKLLVWDLSSSHPKLLLKTDASAYDDIEFTPNSKKVKATAESGRVLDDWELKTRELAIKIWDLETGKAVEFDKVTSGISKEHYISDDHLLIEHKNGITNIFDLNNGNIHELKSFNGKQFMGIHYNEKEKRLTTITKDGLARVMYTHPDSIIKEVNSRKGGVWKLDEKTSAKYGLSSKD